MNDSTEISKYGNSGAYHWGYISSSIRKHNVYATARYKKILTYLGEVNGKSILDAGGGDGALSYQLKRLGGTPVVSDLSSQALLLARHEFQKHLLKPDCIQNAAERLPIDDSTFDAVVACEVIEHLSMPQEFLHEAARVLKPSGQIILTTPLRITETPHHARHCREFFPGDFRSLLENDFSAVQIEAFSPVFWYELINLRPRLFFKKPVVLYLLNCIELILGTNPCTGSVPFRYQSCLIGSGRKKNSK